ncbi:hypothetical protein BN1110_05678 [bacterium YEK0313]|nr:hypothetical protein BN1110_05678 [bacterium YEK0313]
MGRAKESGGWGEPLQDEALHRDEAPIAHKPGEHAKEPGGWGENPRDGATPHTGGPPTETGRDEPNRSGGRQQGNQGRDRQGGDKSAPKSSTGARTEEALVRGMPPKPHKRYSLAGQ